MGCENSDSRVVFVGDNPIGGNKEKYCAYRLHEILDKLEKVEAFVVMDGVDMPEHDKCMSWSDFIDKGKDVDYSSEKRVESITPDDAFSLIYTSGTTGNQRCRINS